MATLYASVVAALVALVVAWATNRNSRRGQDQTNVLETKRVDLSVLTESLDELRSQVGRLDRDLGTEKRGRLAAERRALAAETRADEAGRRANALERRVGQLEAVMRTAELAIPPDLRSAP